MEKGIKLVNVTKVYLQGEVAIHALDGVSAHIAPGEFVSVFGPSGSGKTTFLHMIGGLDTPTTGEVYIDGERIDTMSRSERAHFRLQKIGFVFQAYNLIPVLSARENVEFVMELQGVPANERRELSDQLLKDVGLKGMEDRRPGQLSGGQQQRVAVARALVSRPSLVLADEPTANLDSKTAVALLDMMITMNKKHNVTFVFSTHDPLVMQRARRLIEIQDGQIVSDKAQG